MRKKDIDRIRAAALEILALTEKAEPQAAPTPPRAGRKPSLDDAGEQKALSLLNAGHTKREVARQCGVSPTTINNHFEFAPKLKSWRRKAGK